MPEQVPVPVLQQELRPVQEPGSEWQLVQVQVLVPVPVLAQRDEAQQ